MGDSNEEPSKAPQISEDILNVIQSGQIKTSTSNKLSLLMDSSSEEEEEEEEEEIVKKKPRKKTGYLDSEGENGGFLSDGYDADLYGDSEDRARLAAITEVEREAILYERAQARQARQERRALEQRIRDREEASSGTSARRAVPKEVDLKRKKLVELKAKRQKRLERAEEEGEEGEFDDQQSEDDEESESEEETRRRRVAAKKKSRKHRARKDSDDDYYTDDEEQEAVKKPSKPLKSDQHINIEDADVPASELDLDLANKLRLTRDILAQWVYRNGFEDIVQRALLRINLGPGRSGQPTYRVVELKKLVQHHRTYLVKPGTPTNLAALVKFAKNERIFSFEFVSNSPFTPSEFAYWKSECDRAAVKIPYNSVTARRKIDKFKAFNAEPLTDALIQNMLQRRKELTTAQNAPRNLLAEQTILQQQLKEALERGGDDYEEVSRIEAELAAITTKRQLADPKDRLAGMEDLNKRNRLVNLETGRQAEISRLQAELPSAIESASDKKKPPTLDPFQRRKCKPTLIHMNDNSEDVMDETATATGNVESSPIIPIVENVKPETKNLFDAHNFDLDLDI